LNTLGVFARVAVFLFLVGGCEKTAPCGQHPPAELSASMKHSIEGFLPKGVVVCEAKEEEESFKTSTSSTVRLQVSFTEGEIEEHRNRFIREFEAAHSGWTQGRRDQNGMSFAWFKLGKDCPVSYVYTAAGRSEQGVCRSLRVSFFKGGGKIPPGASIMLSTSKNKS
jgi:hypothetical protein